MFDLPLRCQLFQGPVVRTWNCVTNFANLLWYKFYHIGYLTMPRSRRRHHSRSRTRSRSNSVERTRDPKRRKIDSYDETHKRSLSSEYMEPDDVKTTEKMETLTTEEGKIVIISNEVAEKMETSTTKEVDIEKSQESVSSSSANDESKSDCDLVKSTDSKTDSSSGTQSLTTSKAANSEITPKKALTPMQLKKRLESAKRREEKEKEREEKRLKLLEEKKLLRDEKEKQRLEKQEQKQKELELKEDKKKKEQEEKDLKRKKEQEEKEAKRKEKEEKIEQKRKEIEEKTKEKQKEENKKQKISAAFVNFFTKKTESPFEKKVETVSSSSFMPFEVKSDMRLAPLCRKQLSDEQKHHCLTSIKKQGDVKTYLEELKTGKEIGTDGKTWIDDEVEEVIIVEDLGESIVHQTDSTQKWRAKFLKFHENRRPAYYGTWRKKSKLIKPLKPFTVDEDLFNYDADSDEDWEEEEPGESVGGSDDEEKDEPEIDYDYDNFLVPHGYLSDSEVNDEEEAVANPEDHKLKLKILKKEFDDEMSEKAQKLKPRMIGCIWYNKGELNVDENTHNFLKPFFMIAREQIKIKKRSAVELSSNVKQSPKSIARPLEDELVPEFLKFVHGSSISQKVLVKEFLINLKNKNINSDASQKSLQLQLRTLAEWKRSQNKFCWCVRENVMKDYKVQLPHV